MGSRDSLGDWFPQVGLGLRAGRDAKSRHAGVLYAAGILGGIGAAAGHRCVVIAWSHARIFKPIYRRNGTVGADSARPGDVLLFGGQSALGCMHVVLRALFS